MTLENALAERDPVLRKRLLHQWAVLVDRSLMEETMARIEAMENPELRKEACRALLAVWIQQDIDKVAVWFGAEGSDMRLEARDFLLAAMGRWEPEKALGWLGTTLSPRARDLLYEPFFMQWADADTAAACAKLLQLANGRLLGQAVARWAAADAPGAVDWVKALPAGPLQAQAMLDVSYRWAETAPLEAATYASQQSDPELLRAVVGKWADQSPQAAAAWVVAWPPGDTRERALAHLASIWSQKDPAAAAAYTQSLPTGTDRDQAMVAVATVWAYASPDQAGAWISQLPEGPAREQALQRLIVAWAGGKPEDAAKWLDTLPHGGSTDFAISAYSSTLADTSPDQAFHRANSISSEPMRHQQLERVAGVWMLKDQSAARAAISQSALRASSKARLLSNPALLGE